MILKPSSRPAEAKLQLKSLRSEPELGLHNSWVENQVHTSSYESDPH